MNLSLKSFLPAIDLGWKSTRDICAFRDCHNKQLMRAVPQSRIGIRMAQSWYCSVDCFVMAARTPLAALSNRRIMEMPRNPRQPLGLVMLSKGYLTAEQLRFAMKQCQWSGEELEAALIRLGLATEKQLAAARAAQWGYPVLASDSIDQIVESDIPRILLHACSAVPLHHSVAAKKVLLGFVCRVDHSLLESVEQATACRAEPCFITPSEFAEQMERLAVGPDYEEVVIDDPGPPEKMTRTVGRFAVEIAAREASLTQCKHYIWARLSGKRGRIDLIFRLKNVAATEIAREFAIFEQTAASLG